LLTEPWRTMAPLHHYLRRARAAGVNQTIVFPISHTDCRAANRELARMVARHPGRLIGFASVHASRDAGKIRPMVEEAVTRFGLRG